MLSVSDVITIIMGKAPFIFLQEKETLNKNVAAKMIPATLTNRLDIVKSLTYSNCILGTWFPYCEFFV